MSQPRRLAFVAGLVAFSCLASSVLAAPRPGLNIGSVPGGTDIVYDGVVSPDFDDPSDSWTVPSTLAAVTFYLSLNDSALGGSPPSQNIGITLEYLNSLVNITVNAPNPYVSIGWENQLPLELDFQCLETGAAVVGVQLGMSPYGVTTFFFIKECSLAPYRQNFSIASSMAWLTSPDVVVNGKLSSNFSLDVDYGDNTTFQVYLTMLAGGSQFYNVTNIDSDEVVMIPSWTYIPSDQLAMDLTTAPPNQLVITYACMLPGLSDVVVSIDVPNFRPIEFTFKKGCPLPPDPYTPSKDDGGGLSKGSIAAIVLCVLFVSACVAGCAFNRISRQREGLAIIPGYVTLQNLAHKLRLQSSYRPQTDYESRLATHDTYGTYQSNL